MIIINFSIDDLKQMIEEVKNEHKGNIKIKGCSSKNFGFSEKKQAHTSTQTSFLNEVDILLNRFNEHLKGGLRK